MNKDEYVISNRIKIEERIGELEKVEQQQVGNLNAYIARGEIRGLKQVLSNSIELIPEIEKAYNEAFDNGITASFSDSVADMKLILKDDREDYINQLKLDI